MPQFDGVLDLGHHFVLPWPPDDLSAAYSAAADVAGVAEHRFVAIAIVRV